MVGSSKISTFNKFCFRSLKISKIRFTLPFRIGLCFQRSIPGLKVPASHDLRLIQGYYEIYFQLEDVFQSFKLVKDCSSTMP